MKMSNEKRNFCEAFSFCYVSVTVTCSLHSPQFCFGETRKKSHRVYQAPKIGSDTLGIELFSALEGARSQNYGHLIRV